VIFEDFRKETFNDKLRCIILWTVKKTISNSDPSLFCTEVSEEICSRSLSDIKLAFQVYIEV
jgi:hypothetical protein